MPYTRPSGRDGFSLAIICALPLEYDAASYIFDEFWDEDGDQYGRANGDPNSYTTGRIGDYNVVLALLPHMGKVNAASAATSMRSSYPQIRLALLVGVCGGVPLDRHTSRDVFLGDVVISQTVMQYDFGRQYPDKFVRKDTVQDSLGRANKDIRNLVGLFQTDRGQDKLQERVALFLHQIQSKVDNSKRRGKYDYPGTQKDQLFAPQHRHKHYSSTACICHDCLEPSDPVCNEALNSSCATLGCDNGEDGAVERIRSQSKSSAALTQPSPEIHVGLIASGDSVLKSAIDRQRIHKETGAIAFEMEGAGVWDEVPCIVVKGVCDYADSHKHKGWQNYAAATAAAASKAIVKSYVRTDKADAERKPEAEVTTANPPRDTSSSTGGTVFQAPISGHNVVAGTTVTSGGTANFDFRS